MSVVVRQGANNAPHKTAKAARHKGVATPAMLKQVVSRFVGMS